MDILSSQGRVFIAEPRMYGDVYEYHGCMKAESMSRQGRTLTQVWNGKNIAAQVSQRGSQWTETLSGNIAYGQESTLKRAFETGCILMIQVHWGTTGNPTDFSGYEAAVVFENVVVTDYSTSALTASNKGEAEFVRETVTIAFESAKWISNPYISLRSNPVNGAVVAMTLATTIYCDTCDSCGRLYMMIMEQVSDEAQNFRFMWSDDGGATFSSAPLTNVISLDIDLGTLEYTAMAASSRHLFFSIASHLYAVSHTSLQNEIAFIPYAITDISILYSPIKMFQKPDGVYVMTNGAYVYRITDSLTVETLIGEFGYGAMNPETGSQSFLFSFWFGDYNHVSRIWTDRAYRTLTTILGTSPASMWMEDKDGRGWAGTSDGNLYCGGLDGYNWRLITNFAPGCVTDMIWESHSVGYLCAGRYIYRTINGGYDWQPISSNPSAQTHILCLALCADGTLFAGGADNAGTECFALDIAIPEAATPVFAVVA